MVKRLRGVGRPRRGQARESDSEDERNGGGIDDTKRAELELEREKLVIERERLQLERDKMAHELELTRMRIENPENGASRGAVTANIPAEIGLEKLVKTIRVLTLPAPKLPEGWDMFFMSIERAFRLKHVPNEQQGEILINIMGERMAVLLTRLDEEELSSYEALKNLVLAEYQPSPQACLEQFKKAKRNKDETFVQYATRININFEYYCKLRKIDNFDKLKKLIVSDRLFESLEGELATHISVKQGLEWLEPKELAQECDIYEESRNRSKGGVKNKGELVTLQNKKADTDPWWRNAPKRGCFFCGGSHLLRDCPKKGAESHKEGSHRAKVSQVKAENEPNAEEIKMDQPEKETSDRNFDERAIVMKVEAPASDMRGEVNKIKFYPLERVELSVEGGTVSGLVDSGSEIILVNEKCLKDRKVENKGHIILKGIFGEKRVPLQYVNLALPIIGGECNIIHTPFLCAIVSDLDEDVIIPPPALGILSGKREIAKTCVITRAQAKGQSSDPPEQEIKLDRSEQGAPTSEQGVVAGVTGTLTAEGSQYGQTSSDLFRRQQENCPNLTSGWEHARTGKGNYYIVNYLLFHRDRVLGESVGQLVVPECRRGEILKLAHESAFGAHMGAKKTIARIRYSFHWEGLSRDAKAYCSSCEGCQLRIRVQVKDRAPITPVTRPALPFEVCSVDLIGPIDPPSSAGHKYVLCLVCQHSRWAEAVALKSLTAKATCDALLHIFTRTGIPSILASDNGTNFNSELTKEFGKRLGASPRFSTPAYPQANGLVEKFNLTLKNALHHLIRSDVRDWHKQLDYLLWAYREVPHSTTGVSPFTLLYGRPPEGPLSILKSTWAGSRHNAVLEGKPVHKYLEEMKGRMQRAAEQARVFSDKQQKQMADYYNSKSKERDYCVGEQVIVLIRDSSNKLYSRWKGPGTIVKKNAPHTFIVELNDGSTCHVHQNKIRPFVARINSLNIIFEGEEEFGEIANVPTDLDPMPEFEKQLEGVEVQHLMGAQKEKLWETLRGLEGLFSAVVKPARVRPHIIELIPGAIRKKPHQYSIPEVYRKEVKKQTDALLHWDLIEPSNAEIAYPIVCVAKKDATMRMCCDYRSLNACSKKSAFPMKVAQELIFTAGRAQWLTTLDFLKGYHQIPVHENSRHLTAFRSFDNVYQWKTMPFGLATAGASFQYAVNEVLRDHISYAQAYIDDVIIYSNSFDEHLRHIQIVCQELLEVGFTARLDKCRFARREVKYLGHVIGGGSHRPDPEKIASIKNLKRPISKKELRSVLGLMGFYRSYIPDYANLSLPLTELTKKQVPSKIPWGEAEQRAFEGMKYGLTRANKLATPDLNKPFQIHSDASNFAVAACLTQRDKINNYVPIAFTSKKLTATQKNWSTIEKEAFAVLHGLSKFENWIFASKVEIITDHDPLQYLTATTPKNPKLTRWALALQRWDLSITHISGKKNFVPDALSRLECE